MHTHDWQEDLIGLYCFLAEQYHEHLWTYVERFSPNHTPAFRDEEVLTVYLFGLLRQCRSRKAIYRYTRDHLSAFFPCLPSYQGWNHRLNRLGALLPALVEELLERLPPPAPSSTHLLDSMPIILAQGVRAHQARVASEIADMGYCASKKSYFHGVKLHTLALHCAHTLPRPEMLWLSSGSYNDGTVAQSYTPSFPSGELYADKIYQNQAWQQELQHTAQITLRTPHRRARGEPPLDAADRLWGRAVSRVRQPIECFFAWLQKQTHIQNASQVRSAAGLYVHVFGCLAAALLSLSLNS